MDVVSGANILTSGATTVRFGVEFPGDQGQQNAHGLVDRDPGPGLPEQVGPCHVKAWTGRRCPHGRGGPRVTTLKVRLAFWAR